MLGSDLVAAFDDYNVVAWDYEDLDITNAEDVLSKIQALKPDIILNAAAYTDVDKAEEESEKARALNVAAVTYLAEACRCCDAILVHYSTDYVFHGDKDGEYDENDELGGALNTYGSTKLAGEKNLRGKFYLIRTSWLYGHNGKNFIETMLSLAEKGEVNVVNDQIGKPTYTVDLAQATRELIEDNAEFGTYHLVNEGAVTWYDFAKEIFQLSGLDVKVTPLSTEELKRPAKRPSNSRLKNTKRPPLRSYEEALKDYLTTRK